MHSGTPGSADCKEICNPLPIFTPSYKCGICDAYDITMNLVGDDGIIQQDASIFAQAAAVWMNVITRGAQDLPPALHDEPKSDLGIEGCSFPETIDDLVICAAYLDLDGPGKFVGYSQPTLVRSKHQGGLVYAGEMVFDLADLDRIKASGHFVTVITHEIGHVLGIGLLWVDQGLAPILFCTSYKGEHANAEFQAISGCSNESVPLESVVCSHWDEDCLQTELMTAVFRPKANATAPLSRITVGGLHDLGYTVDYDKADPFTTDDLNENCTCAGRRRNLRDGDAYGDGLFGQPTQEEIDYSNSKALFREPRQLSVAVHRDAVKFGLSILDRNRQKRRILAARSADKKSGESNLLRYYVGDQVVSVLVEDEGYLHSVLVSSGTGDR